MQYYAIKRKKDGKFVSGTDFRYFPPHSIFADEYRPILLLADIDIMCELRRRRINQKHYTVVAVEVKEQQQNNI